jgi:hypothetical protein
MSAAIFFMYSVPCRGVTLDDGETVGIILVGKRRLVENILAKLFFSANLAPR